jgi:hypothetical protein
MKTRAPLFQNEKPSHEQVDPVPRVRLITSKLIRIDTSNVKNQGDLSPKWSSIIKKGFMSMDMNIVLNERVVETAIFNPLGSEKVFTKAERDADTNFHFLSYRDIIMDPYYYEYDENYNYKYEQHDQELIRLHQNFQTNEMVHDARLLIYKLFETVESRDDNRMMLDYEFNLGENSTYKHRGLEKRIVSAIIH